MKNILKLKKATKDLTETAKEILSGSESTHGIILGFKDGRLDIAFNGKVNTIAPMIILASLTDDSGKLAECLDEVERVRKSVRDEYQTLSADQLAGYKAALVDVIKKNI
ncbi:MAG: hypothetical protein IJK22_04195 [Bacteroidales bacterium]|nr:hypothetical protein [Bacteroidales bacterium]